MPDETPAESQATETPSPAPEPEVAPPATRPRVDPDAFLAERDADDDVPGVRAGSTPPEAPQAEEKQEPEREGEDEKGEPVHGEKEAPKPAEEEQAEDEEGDEDFERALSALRLDGVPKSLLKGLSRAETKKWGLARAKSQAEVSRALQERAELQKRVERDSETTDGAAEAAVPNQPSTDLAKVFEPFGAFLAENLGIDKTEGARAASVALVPALKQLYGPLAEAIQGLHHHVGLLTAEAARVKLRERFPQFDEPAKFSKALAKAEKYLRAGDHETHYEALEQAGEVLYGAEIAKATGEKAAKERERESAPRTNGLPTAKTEKRGPRSLSSAEKEELFLNLLEKGHPKAEAQRLAGFR
jgi:hypothetical protein